MKPESCPPVNAPAKASLSHDMTPFPKQYDWLGFEVRRLIYQLLDEVIADPLQKLDALIYECKEPEILKRDRGSRQLGAVLDRLSPPDQWKGAHRP